MISDRIKMAKLIPFERNFNQQMSVDDSGKTL